MRPTLLTCLPHSAMAPENWAGLHLDSFTLCVLPRNASPLPQNIDKCPRLRAYWGNLLVGYKIIREKIKSILRCTEI